MRIIDLSCELYHRTPTYPGQPPIIHGVWKTHEEAFADSGNVHESLCNLETLIGQGEFRFIGLPLKWHGGTGSPIRVVAMFDA